MRKIMNWGGLWAAIIDYHRNEAEVKEEKQALMCESGILARMFMNSSFTTLSQSENQSGI